jgi:carboxylesterase
MNLDKIPADTTVNPFGRPLFFQGGDEAVLVIHGFTGRTSEMSFLAEHLNGLGYTVSVPRLPGHGTNGKDFLQSDRHQWLRHVVDSYLELRARYNRVYVVGLSMGGVLAVLLASTMSPDALALCAPALRIRKRNIVLTPLLSPFVARFRVPYEPDSDDPVEQELQLEYYAYQWVRPGAELYRLMKQARRRLAEVTAPTLTVVSESDTMVPPDVAAYVESRICARDTRRLELTDSNHIVINDVDRERVASEIAAWFAAATGADAGDAAHTVPRSSATSGGERSP